MNPKRPKSPKSQLKGQIARQKPITQTPKRGEPTRGEPTRSKPTGGKPTRGEQRVRGAVILAGGASRRMEGGDKFLKTINGRVLLDMVLARLKPQAQHILLNINGSAERVATFGLPTRADRLEGSLGPLAGVLTGLEWLKEKNKQQGFLLTVPADAPFFPLDLKQRLAQHLKAGTKIVVATDGKRTHPTFALWHTSIAKPLNDALVNQKIRKIMHFVESQPFEKALFEDPKRFVNLNSPEDFATAEEMAPQYGE